LAITILPKQNDQATQTTNKIQIQAQPFAWGKYDFAKPTKPGSLAPPMKTAKYLAWAGIAIGSFAVNYI
jgi:hypothetical protein